MMNPRLRKAILIVSLAIGLPLLAFLLYTYHVERLLQSTMVTAQCNSTNSNTLKDSLISYEYAFNPSNWHNLSNYINSTCLSFQNSSEDGLLNPTSMRR